MTKYNLLGWAFDVGLTVVFVFVWPTYEYPWLWLGALLLGLRTWRKFELYVSSTNPSGVMMLSTWVILMLAIWGWIDLIDEVIGA